MKNVLLFAAFAVILSYSSQPAHAGRFSGAYLLELCDMDANGKEKMAGGHTACQSYISGVIDYHLLLQGMKLAPQFDICLPNEVESARLHAIVLKYLRENFQHDDFLAAPAVTTALYQAFPCKGR